MNAVGIGVILLGQVASLAPGEIAAQYDQVIREYNKQLATQAKDRDQATRAARSIQHALRHILNLAEQADSSDFTSGDFIALAESAERLQEKDKAVAYARRATQRPDDIKAYVTLVRCLSVLGHVDEAEAAVCDGIERFPSAVRRYLLHNILGHKYRGLGRLNDAYRHLEATAVLVVEQIEQSPFYAFHLGRCIDELRELAGRVQQSENLDVAVANWQRTIDTKLSQQLDDLCDRQTGFAPSAEELSMIRCRILALLEFDQRTNEKRSEAILCRWLSAILKCENIEKNRTAWLSELKSYLHRASSAINPLFDGDETSARLRELLVAIDRVEPDANQAGDRPDGVRELVYRLLGTLEQHRRHRELVGERFLSDELSKAFETHRSKHSFILVHIFEPLSKTVPQGLQSLRSRSPRERKVDLPVYYLALQSGLGWDDDNRRFQRIEGQTIHNEFKAVLELQRALRISGHLHLLARDSPEAKQLAAAQFPVNLLLDADGRVICVLTGPEPEKIAFIRTRTAELVKGHRR